MITNFATCSLCFHTTDAEGLCQRCHERLSSQLDQIVEFWDAAHGELLPGNGGHGTASSERTLGVNVSALSFIAGDDILKTLHPWEALIRELRQMTPPAFLPKKALADEVHDAIAFQKTHLSWSGAQEWIGDLAQAIRDLHTLGKHAARAFSAIVRRIPCPADIGGATCGRLIPIDTDDILRIVPCKNCGTEWTTFRLMAVALSDPTHEIMLDAEAIGEYLGVDAHYVHKFARRHQIRRRGKLYDIKEIIRLRKAS